MNNNQDWVIPRSLMTNLNKIPYNELVAILLRHSIRPQITEFNDVSITKEGRILANEFGTLLGSKFQSIYTSPVKRCVETAQAICEGAQKSLDIKLTKCLGDPGVFIDDNTLAGPE